jgi:hypothetical protein
MKFKVDGQYAYVPADEIEARDPQEAAETWARKWDVRAGSVLVTGPEGAVQKFAVSAREQVVYLAEPSPV